MEDINFFTFDNNECLKSNIDKQETIENKIQELFNKITITLKPTTIRSPQDMVSGCMDEALKLDQRMFLITDLDYNESRENLQYSCLVPKKKDCDDIINPYKTSLETHGIDLVKGSTFAETASRDVSFVASNFSYLTETNGALNSEKCLNVVNSEGKNIGLSTAGRYTKYSIEPETATDEGTNKVLPTTAKYKICFNNRMKLIEDDISNLGNVIRSMVCDQMETTVVDEKIEHLNNSTNYYIALLDELGEDISYITLHTKHDTSYLEHLQKLIDKNKKNLTNLLGFDGANNGKLSDTKFLNSLKISENIILIFTIVFVIYAYSKN